MWSSIFCQIPDLYIYHLFSKYFPGLSSIYLPWELLLQRKDSTWYFSSQWVSCFVIWDTIRLWPEHVTEIRRTYKRHFTMQCKIFRTSRSSEVLHILWLPVIMDVHNGCSNNPSIFLFSKGYFFFLILILISMLSVLKWWRWFSSLSKVSARPCSKHFQEAQCW